MIRQADIQDIARQANAKYVPPKPEPVRTKQKHNPKVEHPRKIVKVYPIITAEFHGLGSSDRLRVYPAAYPGRGIVEWLFRVLVRPRRMMRLLLWMLRLPGRGYSMLRTVASGRVADDVLAKRNRACQECRFRHLVVRQKRGRIEGHSYCEACNCPKWRLSRLSFKNTRKGWHCPMRLHPGPYPDNDVRAWLLKHKEVRDFPAPTIGGCSGCGGGAAQGR